MLTCCQHRSEIITRFCLSCQASVAFFSHCLARQLLGAAPRDTSQDEHINEHSLAACTPREAKAPALAGAFLTIGSLTMTYFHTGIRTIIGAESFHCPVRDGKEWDQLAMVIRLKRFLTWFALSANQTSQFAESIILSALILIASRREHHAVRDIHRPTYSNNPTDSVTESGSVSTDPSKL